jgi:predicted  nucleic acid-binding Zn-ribbon protein
MNKDVKIMIELQRYWKKMLEEKKKIESNQRAADFWKKELADLDREIASLHNNLQNEKNELKKKELDLAALDEKTKKLEEKRLLVHTEKELAAIDRELNAVGDAKPELEDSILELIDHIDVEESRLAGLSEKRPGMGNKVDSDIASLAGESDVARSIIDQNQKKFDELVGSLNPQFQGKFTKLLGSKNGMAIAELDGVVCTGCNFKVPASVVIEASRDDKTVNCTNCGRYIYRL